MLKVGLTGGIGSGKTLVSRIFRVLDIPVYYADDRAKELMVTDYKIISGLKSKFGEQVYLANGELNKSFLREKIFNDPVARTFIDTLVHPVVREDGHNWFSAQKNTPYAIKEAALLIESRNYLDLDKLILVESPLSLRIPRIIQRDGITAEEAEKRIKSQMKDEEKAKFADFIIKNDNRHSLISQVLEIHSFLKA